MAIRFEVRGLPQPGGSKRAFPIRTGNFKLDKKGRPQEIIRVVVTDDNPKAKGWKALVIDAAREAFPCPPLFGPLRVTMYFYVPYRKQDYGTGKNSETIKPSAPFYPISKPDVLKLARSTEDALTGILWNDDAQVCSLRVIKQYSEAPGVAIEIDKLDLNPDHRRLCRL